MKKDSINKEKTAHGHGSGTTLADWLWGLIPAAAGAILYAFFGDREWFDMAAIGLGALLLIGLAVTAMIVLRRGRAVPKPCGEDAEKAPYEIRDPLFKTIMEQYRRDGLSDFINYVSLRGWKLGYVDAREDSIELIFMRGERQNMVCLRDGFAQTCVDLQSEAPKKLRISMEGMTEPVELWNAVIAACRGASRSGR